MEYITKADQERTDLVNKTMMRLALIHQDAMIGMTDNEAMAYIKGVVASATVVWGVYEDEEEPNGFGLYLIKGKRELQEALINGDDCPQFTMNALPSVTIERAETAKLELGDGLLKAN